MAVEGWSGGGWDEEEGEEGEGSPEIWRRGGRRRRREKSCCGPGCLLSGTGWTESTTRPKWQQCWLLAKGDLEVRYLNDTVSHQHRLSSSEIVPAMLWLHDEEGRWKPRRVCRGSAFLSGLTRMPRTFGLDKLNLSSLGAWKRDARSLTCAGAKRGRADRFQGNWAIAGN